MPPEEKNVTVEELQGDSIEDSIAEAIVELEEDEETESEEETDESEESEETGDESESQETEETEESEEETDEPYVAPADWSSEDQEAYNTLPRKSQEFINRQVNEVQNIYTELQNHAQKIDQHSAIVDRAFQYGEALGENPLHAMDFIGNLVVAAKSGDNAQKRQALEAFIQFGGITPEGITAAGPGPNNSVSDPRIGNMQEKLNQLEQERYFEQQNSAQQTYDNTWNSINNFATEKDSEGNLTHPYVADVENEMVYLAQADIGNGSQPDLQSLYDRACWINPQVRGKIQKNTRIESVKKAKKSKTATKGRTTGVKAVAEDSYDDMGSAIEAAIAELNG